MNSIRSTLRKIETGRKQRKIVRLAACTLQPSTGHENLGMVSYVYIRVRFTLRTFHSVVICAMCDQLQRHKNRNGKCDARVCVRVYRRTWIICNVATSTDDATLECKVTNVQVALAATQCTQTKREIRIICCCVLCCRRWQRRPRLHCCARRTAANEFTVFELHEMRARWEMNDSSLGLDLASHLFTVSRRHQSNVLFSFSLVRFDFSVFDFSFHFLICCSSGRHKRRNNLCSFNGFELVDC